LSDPAETIYTITITVDDEGEMIGLRVQSTDEQSDGLDVAILLMDASRALLVDLDDDTHTNH